MLDSSFTHAYGLPSCFIHIAPRASSSGQPNSSKCLFVLSLPLEAESLVDKELAEEGDEGHNDGDAVDISDHLC